MAKASEKRFVGWQATPEEKERVAALARATGLSRSEFLRRAVKLAEKHLSEIREPVPEDPRRRWRH